VAEQKKATLFFLEKSVGLNEMKPNKKQLVVGFRPSTQPT